MPKNKDKAQNAKQQEPLFELELDKNLAVIESSNHKNPTYFLFDTRLIKNSDKISSADLDAFMNIFKHPKLISRGGIPGIRYLKENQPKCELSIGGGAPINTHITSEMKIKSSKNRIALAKLDGTNTQPTILIATEYVKSGFHKAKDTQKDFSAKLPKLSGNLMGFFSANRPAPEAKNNQPKSSKPANKKN